MKKTEYKVYWTEDNEIYSQNDYDLTAALGITEALRKRRREGANISFITMVSENVDNIGEMGVDAVKDGKTPNGENYTWVKRRPPTDFK